MEEERRLWKNLKQIVSGESPESKEEVQEAVEYVVEECGSQGYLEEKRSANDQECAAVQWEKCS